MSYNVNKNWFYQLSGRELHLYHLTGTGSTFPDELGRFRLDNVPYKYPAEDITNGLRIEYTAIEKPFISESLDNLTARNSGTTISFSGSIISDSASGFGDFSTGDYIRIRGSSDNDGDYIVTTAASSTLTCSATTFTTETASESITVFQRVKEITSPDETSHINISKMLSMAIVDYVKAQLHFDTNNENLGEYYMHRFYKRIGDEMSNRRKQRVSVPKTPYALMR